MNIAEESVRPGVNAIPCRCKEGTVMIPVNMTVWARIRSGVQTIVEGNCQFGHTNKMRLKDHGRVFMAVSHTGRTRSREL